MTLASGILLCLNLSMISDSELQFAVFGAAQWLSQTAFGIMRGYNATVRTLFSRMPPKSIRRAVQCLLVAE
jgi:hypothetical protein